MPDAAIPPRKLCDRIAVYLRVEAGLEADMMDADKVIETVPYIAQRFIYGLAFPADEAIRQVTTIWQ